MRVERVVELDGSTTLEAVFTGHLLDGDGARIGVGSRRQQVPATLVRGPEGSWLSVGAVEVDLLGLPVSVPGFTVATTGASRRFGRPDAAVRPHTPEELR